MWSVGASDRRSEERRRQERVRLSAPIRFEDGLREEKEGGSYPYTGHTADLSTAGAYMATVEGGPFVPGQILQVSVAIPWEARRHFPFSRIIGPCRVVRVETLSAEDPQGARWGVGLAFCGERITLLGDIMPA